MLINTYIGAGGKKDSAKAAADSTSLFSPKGAAPTIGKFNLYILYISILMIDQRYIVPGHYIILSPTGGAIHLWVIYMSDTI